MTANDYKARIISNLNKQNCEALIEELAIRSAERDGLLEKVSRLEAELVELKKIDTEQGDHLVAEDKKTE